MQRKVEDEQLDSLPEGDPEAMRNRRDIYWINQLQGNFRWIHRMVRRYVGEDEEGVELGAGTGELGDYLYRRGSFPPGVTLEGIDLWKRPDIWPEAWGWQQRDATSLRAMPGQFVVGNLIFHQFEPEVLAYWGRLIRANCRLVIACETVRRERHLRQLHLLRPLRMSEVSWHDARVSIRAGFRGNELADYLGLPEEEWHISVRETFLGAYRFVAVRREEILVPVENLGMEPTCQ